MTSSLSIILIALVTAIASSIIGLFLVLRKMSMLIDAISHTVLFGIVIGFLLVGDINSPWVVIAASATGVLTSWLIELLIKSKNISEDAATGVVFPLLFSLAILIISSPNSNLRNTNINVDSIFIGNIEFASIEQISIGFLTMPKNLILPLVVLIINVAFITIFYKELKLVSFDSALASVLGFSPVIIHYLLTTLVSVTAVIAFDLVGAIMVVSLMIGPGATALMLTKDLKKTLLVTVLIAIINVLIGYTIGDYFVLPISGGIAITTMLVFLLVAFVNPREGIIISMFKRRQLKYYYKIIAMLIHIRNHEGSHDEADEISLDTIVPMLNWNPKEFNKICRYALDRNYIYIDNNILRLTNDGIKFKEKYL
ncbi:MAG: metal ABC transporter permease [Acholeplasmataceae bacterium]|jgi:manganese/zinc/iron transport system permease protein